MKICKNCQFSYSTWAYLGLWHDLKIEIQTRIFFFIFLQVLVKKGTAEVLTTKAHFWNTNTLPGYSTYFAIVQWRVACFPTVSTSCSICNANRFSSNSFHPNVLLVCVSQSNYFDAKYLLTLLFCLFYLFIALLYNQATHSVCQ